MKRACVVAAFAVAASTVAMPAASAAQRLLPPGPIVVSVTQGQAVPSIVPSAVGSGVNPSSRDGSAFLAAVSAGAPVGDVTTTRPGRPGLLAQRLAAAGITAAADGPRSRLVLYGTTDAPPSGAPDPMLRVTDRPDPAASIQIIVPTDGRTPLDVRVTRTAWGLLDGGQSRRPMIVTPYDLTATILAHFGVPLPSSVVGRPLNAEPHSDPVGARLVLNMRMLRDASFMQSLTAWTIVVGLGAGWLLAFIFAWLGRRNLAGRMTTGASFVTVGFLIALLVPSPRGDVRALAVIAMFVIGAIVPWRDREAAAMGAFIVASGATAVLAVAAAADPGGPVASALWGNPLVSWRLFGLQNFATAFIAGGVVVAATRLGLRALPLGLLSAAMLIVVGSPRIGANFVAVLTFAFGAAFAVAAVRRRALRPSMIGLAAAVALAAFALALVSDAGNATSHGGAAAREIGSGGVGAVWDLSLDRLRLNVRAINAFPGGWAWVVLFLGLYGAMIRDAFSRAAWPLAGRAAIAAGALAGLAALALEDSGFKTTAVLGFPALMLWTLARTNRENRTDHASAG